MGREIWVGEYGYNSVRQPDGGGRRRGSVGEAFREDTLDLWHAVGLDLLAFPALGGGRNRSSDAG
jgi:hypothetical protein